LAPSPDIFNKKIAISFTKIPSLQYSS